MLMHHPNAACHGVARASEMHRDIMHDKSPSSGLAEAIEDVHQRGLPRAVFPQQRWISPSAELEVYMIVGHDTGEMFGDTAHFERQSHCACLAHRQLELPSVSPRS